MKKFYIFAILIHCLLIFGCTKNNITYDISNNFLTGEKNNGDIEKGNVKNKNDEVVETTNKNIYIEDNGTILIPTDGIVYKNDKYGFQVKLGKERGGGKIYNSGSIFNKENGDGFYPGTLPIFIFTVPNPHKIGSFDLILYIVVYTYDEFEKRLLYEENLCNDTKIDWCSLEDFKQSIIGKNNKYYFGLEKTNNSDDQLKLRFPSLECREEINDNIYGNNYGGYYTYCDGIEYINGEPKKTGKNWIEQILPVESFEFFDI